MNIAESNVLIGVLKSIYVREQFTDDSPKMYLWLLDDLNASEVMAAVKIHGRRLPEGRFCPTPAELRGIITESREQAVPVGDAWEVVQKQIRRHGYSGWEAVDFGNPAILAAVKAVTWKRMCHDENQQFVRRDFDKHYEDAVKDLRRDAQVGDATVSSLAAPSAPALKAAS